MTEEDEHLMYQSPFNVRGTFPEHHTDKNHLLDVLKLAFAILDESTAKAYRIDKRLGLILYWTDATESGQTIHPFITPLTPEQIYPQVQAFIESYYNKEIDIDLEEGDTPYLDDDDITNVEGYRVYTGQWGRVDEDSYAFIAIKPAYDSYGK